MSFAVRLRTRVRPGERRDTLVAFGSLFAFMAGHALLETARDALFLRHVAAEHLPFVYAGIALASLATGARRNTRPPRRGALSQWLVASGMITLLFWPLIGAARWAPYALYVWSAVAVTATLVQFYVLLGQRFTVTQAKRLYSIIGAGSIAGALAGSAAAGILATWFEAEVLLVVAAVVLMLSGLGPLALSVHIHDKAGGVAEGRRSPLLEPLAHPYVRQLALVLVLATLAFTFADYAFKAVVASKVAGSELGRFFGRLYFCLNLASLAVQVLVVPRVVAAMGPARSLAVVPSLLAVAALSGMALGPLTAVVTVKSLDGALRHSLHRTAAELLYVPLAEKLRSSTKALVGVLAHRGGQAVASAGILGLVALGVPNTALLGVVAVLTLSMAIAAVRMRAHYLALLSETLSQAAEQQTDFPELDMASLESLIAALGSPDQARVRAALQLLAARDRLHLVPTLIFYHPSPEVLTLALDLFTEAGRTDFLPNSDPLLQHDFADVRAAALRARMSIEPDEALMRSKMELSCPVMRATALVGLVSYFHVDETELHERLDELVREGSPIARAALARAIARGRPGRLDPWLLRLARSEEVMVLEAVVRTMESAPRPAHLPHLVRFLGIRRLRRSASAALVRLGEVALGVLDGVLSDDDERDAVRAHVPTVICQFPPRRAVAMLLPQLMESRDARLRDLILLALNRVVVEHAVNVTVERKRLEEMLRTWALEGYRLLDWSSVVARRIAPRSDAHDALCQLLRERFQRTLRQLLLLVETLHPERRVTLACAAVLATNGRLRASGLELIESLLPDRCRRVVMGVLDDLAVDDKLAAADQVYRRERSSYPVLLAALAKHDSPAIRSLAERRLGELAVDASGAPS